MKSKKSSSQSAYFLTVEDCRRLLACAKELNPAEELALRAHFARMRKLIADHRSSIRENTKYLQSLKKKMAKV